MSAIVAQILIEILRDVVDIALTGGDDAEPKLKRIAAATAAEKTGKAAARRIIDS